jgi:hypothetical protein
MDSSHVIRMQKWTIRWVGNAACMGRAEMDSSVSRGKIKERDHLEDLGIHGRLKQKLISKQQDERPGTGSICHRRASGGLLWTQYTEP